MCGNAGSHHRETGEAVGEAEEQRGAEKILQEKAGDISMSSRGEKQPQQEMEREFTEGVTDLGKSAGKMFESGGVSQPG